MGYASNKISPLVRRTLKKFKAIMNELEILSMTMQDVKTALATEMTNEDIEEAIQYLTNAKEAVEDMIKTLDEIKAEKALL